LHRLKFTGNLSSDEFNSRCRQNPRWYHSYYFDNGYEIRGEYNIGADVQDYGFPASMAGCRMLDIGTGGGWFSFYFEQLGAEVTTVDARGYSDFDVFGRHYNPPVSSDGREPDRHLENGQPVYDSPVSAAFWVMRDILRSKNRFVNARVYEVRPDLFGNQLFDFVFMGALLCHLRDPVGALMAARSVCGGTLIASTPVVIGEPEAETMPRQYLPYTDMDQISWWLPNEACFRLWFKAAGFSTVDVGRSVTLRCDVEQKDQTGRVTNGDQLLRVAFARV